MALPETNLLLQDRGEASPLRRGVTLSASCWRPGVEVRLGTDNVRDWFFPFGDADMLDTALFAAIAVASRRSGMSCSLRSATGAAAIEEG